MNAIPMKNTNPARQTKAQRQLYALAMMGSTSAAPDETMGGPDCLMLMAMPRIRGGAQSMMALEVAGNPGAWQNPMREAKARNTRNDQAVERVRMARVSNPMDTAMMARTPQTSDSQPAGATVINPPGKDRRAHQPDLHG